MLILLTSEECEATRRWFANVWANWVVEPVISLAYRLGLSERKPLDKVTINEFIDF